MTEDANNFLMGGGVESAKFDAVGTVVRGIVEDFQLRDQTDFKTGEVLHWPDGNVRQQLVVTLLTEERADNEDDGRRRLYIKGQMQAAVREAVQKAGERGLSKGGELAVKYYADGEQKTRGFNPPKLYQAKYTAPIAPVGDDPGDDAMPF